MKGGCGTGVESLGMLAVGLGRFRRWWSCVLACAVLVAGPGCGRGDGGDDRPGPTVPDGGGVDRDGSDGGDGLDGIGSSTSTSAVAIDITVRPATVTVEYANAVMDELDRILSDAIREFVAADGPTKSFDDKLNAVYDEPSLENQRSDYGAAAVDDMDAFKNPPGDVTTLVRSILKSESDCVVLEVERDFGSTLAAPRSDARTTGYVALEVTDADGDPAGLNETPWSIVFDGNVLAGEEPKNTC